MTIQADFTPDRRLHATSGRARNLYAEAIRNMATRNRPEGGALNSIIEVFITKAKDDAGKAGRSPDNEIRLKLADLRELVDGYDFAEVIAKYWQALESDNEDRKTAALRWLRGEYTTKTDAKAALGVRNIVDDSSVYDHWKLLARFVRIAGYGGLVVILDELDTLYQATEFKGSRTELRSDFADSK